MKLLKNALWIIPVIYASMIQTASSAGEKPDHQQQRRLTRTSWPTETGTMVRILRSDKRMAASAVDSRPRWTNDDWRSVVFPSYSPMDLPYFYYQDAALNKRNPLFLRTSRRPTLTGGDDEDAPSSYEDEYLESVDNWVQNSKVPKRNAARPEHESPIFFRTFR